MSNNLGPVPLSRTRDLATLNPKCIVQKKTPRVYSEVLYAKKNDLVCIVDGYMHEVVLYPRVSCKSSCVYPLPVMGHNLNPHPAHHRIVCMGNKTMHHFFLAFVPAGAET